MKSSATQINNNRNRFTVAPCGGGWFWIVDSLTNRASAPRPTRHEAEKRAAEIRQEWDAHEREKNKGVLD